MERLGRRRVLAGLTGSAAAGLLGPRIADAVTTYEPLRLRDDDVGEHLAEPLAPGSHVKVFLPNLPYIYTSHAINAGLLRPAPTAQGWEYDLATELTQVDERTYEATLREGVTFQDGSPFTADAVVENVEHFVKAPFTFTKLHKTLEGAEKLGTHRVRFHLSERYGQFVNDLLWLHFYTSAYLAKHGWNGKAVCPNLAEPGPYGLGPFILREGYLEGDRQTSIAKLEANPHYWREDEPRVEKVTIFTELTTREALTRVQETEGDLDIAPIPFHKKIQTMRTPHSKVVATKSTNNFAIHMNLHNGHEALQDREVRVALNRAIHQAHLLTFVYMNEGVTKPTTAAPYFPGVKDVVDDLRPYSEREDPYDPAVQEELRGILEGLTLKVFTQETFMWLWRGIAYQLSRVGVTLDVETTTSEKDIFNQLFTTNNDNNTKNWDLLIWGMDDWYYNHPWSVFLVYRTTSVWSTIFRDEVLDGHIQQLFKERVGTDAFDRVTEKIMRRVHEQGYMLFVPAPNQVMGVNKEVSYLPYPMATTPLWKVQVSKYHWSVRQGELPDERRAPIKIVRRDADYMREE
ncbi:peptide/nickel transport system substrate-binding protein [Limimonas halophila]|uniref:Peptide/nickel transport system substrate-binding protein n=1 Tax=Limimonas halophila TaxID=1082479 RepID=A0A1G7LPI4_9PROT|nr:ABC transporter substrate-binding protein [Limimonas halophila]SDF51286.1 peptide/nickel transport system substrate-binding protein [Limimonas halophila]